MAIFYIFLFFFYSLFIIFSQQNIQQLSYNKVEMYKHAPLVQSIVSS